MNMASLSNLPSEIGTKIVKLVGENHAIRDILDFHLQDQAIEFQALSCLSCINSAWKDECQKIIFKKITISSFERLYELNEGMNDARLSSLVTSLSIELPSNARSQVISPGIQMTIIGYHSNRAQDIAATVKLLEKLTNVNEISFGVDDSNLVTQFLVPILERGMLRHLRINFGSPQLAMITENEMFISLPALKGCETICLDMKIPIKENRSAILAAKNTLKRLDFYGPDYTSEKISTLVRYLTKLEKFAVTAISRNDRLLSILPKSIKKLEIVTERGLLNAFREYRKKPFPIHFQELYLVWLKDYTVLDLLPKLVKLRINSVQKDKTDENLLKKLKSILRVGELEFETLEISYPTQFVADTIRFDVLFEEIRVECERLKIKLEKSITMTPF